MSIIEALILGIIQGLTEFLPVSSSGHLELAKVILGDKSVPKESMLFTVVLHAATALSTIVIFRKEILEILANSTNGELVTGELLQQACPETSWDNVKMLLVTLLVTV